MTPYAIRLQALYIEARALGFDRMAEFWASLLIKEIRRTQQS